MVHYLMAKIYLIDEDDGNGKLSQHQIPEDLVMHDTSEDGECICGPVVNKDKLEDGSSFMIVRHFALDPQHRWSRPLQDGS